MSINLLNHQKDLSNEFLSYEVIRMAVNLIVWSYYHILLFRESHELKVIVTDKLFYVIGIWIGFVLATFVIDRIGYLKAFKSNALGQMLLMIVLTIFTNSLLDYYMIFAVISGITIGSYFAIYHSYNLKEVHGKMRGLFIDELYGISIILGVFVPILSGAFIDFTKNYQYVFLLGAVIHFVGFILPYKYNKKPKSRIRSEEITRILKREGFKGYAIFNIIFSGFTFIYATLFTIVPFLLIGNEFGVGALGSAIGFFAAISLFLKRRIRVERRIHNAYLAYYIYSIATLIFAVIYTIPVMVIRSLILPLVEAFGDSEYDRIDYDIREKLLGDFTNESALELNLIVETLYLFGRLLVLIPMYFVFVNVKGDPTEAIRLIIGIFAIRAVVEFHWLNKLNRSIRIG